MNDEEVPPDVASVESGMRYRLRTLLIMLAVGPMVLAVFMAILPMVVGFPGITLAFVHDWLRLIRRGEIVGLLLAWSVLAVYAIQSRPRVEQVD